MTGAAIDACAATRILREAIGAKCSTCGAQFSGISETEGAACSTYDAQATGTARKQGVTLDTLVSENSGKSAKQGVNCDTLVRLGNCRASRLISRLRCAARAGFEFRSRLYSRLRRKSCLGSADLSDWIGYRAAGFLLRAAPAGVMINDTEQNRSRRPRRRLRKHSGNVHFRRLQGIPLTPMPPAGGRSSGRAPRKGDHLEQKPRYPPYALRADAGAVPRAV